MTAYASTPSELVVCIGVLFCATSVFKPSERYKVLTHLQSHRLRAIHHERIVDWKSVSPDVRKSYRVEFELTRCDGCRCIYKNTTGYCGHGKKGVFTAFYSDNDFAGFCSMDCYYSMNE